MAILAVCIVPICLSFLCASIRIAFVTLAIVVFAVILSWSFFLDLFEVCNHDSSDSSSDTEAG